MGEFNLDMVQALFWIIAGVVSFYFSLGNARVWTSIAVGFFLVLIGEVIPQTVPLLPGAGVPHVDAMAHIIGTIAINAAIEPVAIETFGDARTAVAT